MAQTTVYSFFYPTAAGDLYPYTEKEADVAALEAALVALGQIFGAGFLLATDANASIVGGSLTASMSKITGAVVGDTEARKTERTAGAEAAPTTGLLTASTTNYIYRKTDGTYVTNTTGTPPAGSTLAASVVTNGSEVTSVNNNPTGRVNFGGVGLLAKAATWTALQTLTTLAFAAGGNLTTDSGTATAVAGAATLNKQAGTITSEALTTAAGADYVLTLTNSLIAATSLVFVSVDNGTNTTEGLSVQRVTPAAGSVAIRIRNTHASAALNGTIKIRFWVVQ